PWRDSGYSCLYVARTGERQGTRCPHRSVFFWSGAVRDGHRRFASGDDCQCDSGHDFFSTHSGVNYLPTTKPARRHSTKVSRKAQLTYMGAKRGARLWHSPLGHGLAVQGEVVIRKVNPALVSGSIC